MFDFGIYNVLLDEGFAFASYKVPLNSGGPGLQWAENAVGRECCNLFRLRVFCIILFTLIFLIIRKNIVVVKKKTHYHETC